MNKLERKIKELEDNIKVLERENKRLTESSEDILFLEQTAEKIKKIEEEDEIIDFLLERISVAKDICLAAFGYFNKGKIEIKNSFCNRGEKDLYLTQITFSSRFNFKLIKNGIYFNYSELAKKGIEITWMDEETLPEIIILIPVKIYDGREGFFVFADDKPNEERIEMLVVLLKQLADMVAVKITNNYLVSSLSELSEKLEEKVAAKTEEFRKAEEKYYDLYENAPDMMFSGNIHTGQIVECNNTFVKKVGLTKEEIIGKPIFDFYDDEFIPIAKQLLIEFQKTGEIKNKELILNSSSGEKFWVLVSGTAIRDNEGKIITSRMILRDITERKKIEQENFEQRLNFKELVENLFDGVTIADETTRPLFVNNKFAEITGYSKEELYNMTGRDFTRPEDFPVLLKQMKDQLAGSPVSKTYQRIIINKSGEEVLVEISTTATIWEGKARRLAIIRDLRDRKRKEAEIKKSEEEYKALIESAPQAIWSVDKEYNYIKFNSYYKNIILAKYGIVVAKGASALEGKEKKLAEFYRKKYNEALKGKRIEFETEQNIAGNRIYFREIFAPIYFEDNVVGVSAIASDISNIKKAEKEIAEHNRKYRLLYSIVPDAVIVTKLPNHTIVDVNEKFVKFTGWEVNEVIGKNVFELDLWDSTEERKRFEEELLTNKVVHNFEAVFRDKNGGKIIGQGSSIIFDIESTPHILTVVSNLTPIIEANEKVKYFFELMKKTEKLANIGSWEYDLKAVKIIWSDNLYKLFGLPVGSKKVTLDYFKKRMHPDDLVKYRNAEKQLLETKKEVSFVFRAILEDGSIKYFENIITPILENGGVIKLQGVIIDITERSIAQTKLLESEAKLREASKIAKLGYWDLDIINNKLEWSDEVYRIFGTEPQSFRATYDAFLSFVHPDDREMVNNTYENALKTKESYDIVHRIVLKDGTVKYIREKCNVFSNAKGKPYRSIRIVQDITKQKQTEIALSMQSQYLKSVFDSINDALFVHDGETYEILDVNNSMLEMFGYSRDEFLKLSLNEFFHNRQPYTANEAKEWMQKAGDEGPQVFEWIAKKKDGTLFWTDVRIRYAIIAGKPRYLVLLQDITERKEANEKIYAANTQLKIIHEIDVAILNSDDISFICYTAIEKLQNMLNALCVCIALFDEDKQNAIVYSKGILENGIGKEKIVALKDAFPEIRQMERGEVTTMPNLDLIPELIKGLQILKKNEIRSLLNIPMLSQGNQVGFLNIGYRIPEGYTDEDIRAVKEVANLIAVAVIKNKLGKQLIKQMDELETIVAKRTEELIYVNKELQDFAYSVSHDLRTPLRAIVGFSQIIKKRIYNTLSGETLQYFDFIIEATQNMEDSITDLLTLSRLGQKDFVTKKISFIEVAKQSINVLQKLVKENNAKVLLPEKNIEFNSNPTLLRQILINLVQNGISYHRKGVTPEVKIEIESEENILVIKVIDNGLGIDKKYHEIIFNVFQRLENSKNLPGNGIGLAIVKKAVVKLGGKISLTSEMNKGTTFIIKIPRN